MGTLMGKADKQCSILHTTLEFLDSEEPIQVLKHAEKILRLMQYCSALRIKPKADGVTLGQLLEV